MNYELYTKVSAFIAYENEMLDSMKYNEWLTLWQDEGMYIVPIDLSSDDYINQLNFAYDNAAMRRMRVARLMTGESISANTNAGTIRMSSRIVASETDGIVNATCALVIHECRLGDNRQFVAEVSYQLVAEGDSFMVKEKIVKLINADHYLRSISYLL